MKSILVIDDDREFREMLCKTLERKNYDVRVASNGEEGYNFFCEKPTDLVITDLIMPKKEGIRTIFELRRDFPKVKIIAISGGGRLNPQSYLETADAFGAIKTFAKPFKLGDILTAIEKIGDHAFNISEYISQTRF